MTPERWKEVEAVLDTALDLPTDARAAYVARACGSDASLRAEVERLLTAIDSPALVPDESAAEFGAAVFARATGSDDPHRTPERIGPYRIVSEAGEGGMGTVYVADRDDGEFRQRVAIKVVRPGLHLDERFRRRFREERTILARFDHPSIARLLDGGLTEDGLPYLVMEYVQGEPLDRWCDGRRTDVPSRLALFAKVCDAVGYLHRHGVVHRDLKPSNILVTPQGEPKLLDFGIAKLLAGAEGVPTLATALTLTGQRLLTPDYASPEQVRGQPVTPASDVYALGVLLFELLTGRRPYKRRGRTLHQIERVILEDEPTRPSSAVTQPIVVDGGVTDGPSRAASLRGTTTDRLRQQLRGDVDAIVLTALRKEPERRYPSADDLSSDIRRHLEGLPVTARGDSVVYRARKLLRRHRVSVAAASVGAAAGVALIVIASRAGGLGARTPSRLIPGETRRIAFSPALELDPTLSPDGRYVAYAADTGDAMRIYLRPVEGGSTRLLTGQLDGYHRAPRWSPDGTQIAFQAHGRTYAVDVDGRRPPRVLAEPDSGRAYAISPAWSPDGRQIAYVQGTSIYVRAAEGGPARKLQVETQWPNSLAWSPDGRWIAFVDQNFAFLYGSEPAGSPVALGNVAPSGIQVVPVDGGPSVAVTNDRALNTSPVWLPDSRTLLFVSNKDGDRDVYQVTLGDDGHPRGPAVRVTAGLGAHSISISRDGRRLAYAVFRGSANIWSLPVRTDRAATDAELRPVTTGSQTIEGMAVSPDGRWIAFDSDRDGRQHIYKVPITGGEPTALTSGPTDDFVPVWSPNGKEIAYYAFDSTGRSIQVVSADGGIPERISDWPRQQRFPSWSNDGKSIVFSSNETGMSELYVATRIKGKWARPQQITSNAGGTARWSPTGRTIAFLRDDGIWTADADGGVPRQVLRIDPQLRGSLGVAEWSPDGQTLFYKWFDERRHMTVRAIPYRGGPSREIARLDDPVRQSRRGELATDGRMLYFTIAEQQGDVWVMELGEGR